MRERERTSYRDGRLHFSEIEMRKFFSCEPLLKKLKIEKGKKMKMKMKIAID